MRLLRRSKTPAATAPAVPDGKLGGKGRPTPKRQRAAPPPPPPTSRKEAYARLKVKSRDRQSKARVGIREGDDRYVLPRDRGPVRRLVRDIVDARRNAGSYAFGVAMVIVLLTYSSALPPVLRLAASYLWLIVIVVVSVDSFLLSRRISRAVHERFPAEQGPTRWHSVYGITRALTFRKMRNPRPQVKIGATV